MSITGRGARHLLRTAVHRLGRPDGHGGGALAAYGALAAVDLIATARLRGGRGPARVAKPLLMPALTAHVLRRRRDAGEPLPTALLAGLGCATVGDAALLADEYEPAFLTGLAAFLGTQLSYTAGMARSQGALRGIRGRPAPAVACFAFWAAANAALRPGLPVRMRLPVAVYSLALTAMGAAALGVGGRTAVGGVSFVVSDTLIGLQAAGHRFPHQDLAVMATYVLGQYLITTGWTPQNPAA